MKKFQFEQPSIKRISISIIATTIVISSFAYIFNGFIGAWIAFLVSCYLHTACILLFPEFYLYQDEYHNIKLLYKLLKDKKCIGTRRGWQLKGYKKIMVSFFMHHEEIRIYRKDDRIIICANDGILINRVFKKVKHLFLNI